MGDEYFFSVQGVAIASAAFTDNDLAPLEVSHELRTLRLSDTHVTDAGLERLCNLTNLAALELRRTVIEPTSLALIFLGPPVGAVLTGIGMGSWCVRWLRRNSQLSESRRRWRFSVREMLVAIFALSLMLALVFGRTRAHQASEGLARSAFLTRFETSFSTSKVQLAQKPVITGGHRALIPESGYMSFMAPGVNEYRVTAPISKNNTRLWAVWSYTCNGEHNDMIYQFAYAEAPTENQLPSSPFPAKAYVNATWQMENGVPK
jgi:hypothetical protein